METIPNFIAGRWSNPSAAERLPVLDPATQEKLGSVPISSSDDVHEAVLAARGAFSQWRRTPVAERARVLLRLSALLVERRGELAAQLSKEHGKNLPECLGEIQRGIENVEHASGMPSLMMGRTLEDVSRGIDCETFRQPLGVFAVITPYNFPVMIPLWFWPYAIAAGNTVVLKPSEQDPVTHNMVVELAVKAGLPPGVLNVVHGAKETSEALVDHPGVVGVSFVGSTPVASALYARAAMWGKRAQALGGAKNHMVVLPDADPDLVAETVVSSIFGSAGQRCLAGSVIVGVASAYDAIRERVLDQANSLVVGRGLEEGVDMGPVISPEHRDRIHRFIQEGEADGASLALDGRGAAVPEYPDGNWVGPTVFEGVNAGMSIGRKEIFGPVAGLTRARSAREAAELVRRSDYANATSIFTQSGREARNFRHAVGVSMIGVNVGVAAPMAFFPFGGARRSFFGDLKAQGRDAVSFYTDQRVVISKWG